jgi:hypothetical protein
MMRLSIWSLLRTSPFALVLLACTTQKIPNTDVEDTELNRHVIEFCEEYRHAVEQRNVGLLLTMADPRYYEDGGNIDAMDDMDYARLAEYLKGKFKDTRAIRYEMRYRRVGKGRTDTVTVDYTYSASYKLATEEGDVWRRTVADNRLELRPVDESYKILSGM